MSEALLLLIPTWVSVSLPVFTDTNLDVAYLGSAYSGGVSASNGGGTLVFAVASGTLPPGVTLDTATGTFPGTPTAIGVYTFTISATNEAGTTTTGTLTIVVAVNVFTQSLNPNRVTNGDFASGLTGWNSVGSPSTLEVVGGRLHVIGSANAGVSAAALFSPMLALGVYEIIYDVQVVSGSLFTLQSPSNTAGYVASHNAGVNQTFYGLGSPPSVVQRGSLITGGSGVSEFYFGNHVVAFITQNSIWTMQSANGTYTLSFTLPASPKAGQRIDLRIRVQDASNYIVAYLVRNAANTNWDARVDTVSAGAVTSRISSSNVGNIDALRLVSSGSSVDFYTIVGTTPTKRNGTITYAPTYTGITVVHSSPFTPLLITPQ